MVKWPFQRLSDLQLGDKKATLNHMVYTVYIYIFFLMFFYFHINVHVLGISDDPADLFPHIAFRQFRYEK